jgi:hypothetical protein
MKFNSKIFNLDPAPRTLLFYFAVPIQLVASAVSGVGFVQNSPVFYLLGSVIWLIWFVIMFFIGMPSFDLVAKTRIRFMKKYAKIIFVIFLAIGIMEIVTLFGLHSYLAQINSSSITKIWNAFNRGFGYNDATALTHQATDNLLDGKNPYANSNVVTALLRFNNYSDRVTPLREGRFSDSFPYPSNERLEVVWNEVIKSPQQIPDEYASKLSYPAGSFLLPVPFVLIGISDFRIIFTIIVLLTIIYVIYLLPKSNKLLFLGIILISFDLWNSIADGETGSLVFPFLLLAFVLFKRKIWLSALFMGIAVATKQTAWFFLPFYFIMVFRTFNLKTTGFVASIITIVFLATNLPFILIDAKLWLASVVTPMSESMFPLGVGLVTLVTSGLINIQSSLIFEIMEFTVLGLGLFWYFFNYLRFPLLGPVLAIFPLFFAWRSLWPYFFYTIIIVLAMKMIGYEEVNNTKKLESLSP